MCLARRDSSWSIAETRSGGWRSGQDGGVTSSVSLTGIEVIDRVGSPLGLFWTQGVVAAQPRRARAGAG